MPYASRLAWGAMRILARWIRPPFLKIPEQLLTGLSCSFQINKIAPVRSQPRRGPHLRSPKVDGQNIQKLQACGLRERHINSGAIDPLFECLRTFLRLPALAIALPTEPERNILCLNHLRSKNGPVMQLQLAPRMVCYGGQNAMPFLAGKEWVDTMIEERLTLPHAVAHFRLGRIVIDGRSARKLSSEDMIPALGRHMLGDWGKISISRRKANQLALLENRPLCSIYFSSDGVKFRVTTNGARSRTTLKAF